jgi:hypothetical protein
MNKEEYYVEMLKQAKDEIMLGLAKMQGDALHLAEAQGEEVRGRPDVENIPEEKEKKPLEMEKADHASVNIHGRHMSYWGSRLIDQKEYIKEVHSQGLNFTDLVDGNRIDITEENYHNFFPDDKEKKPSEMNEKEYNQYLLDKILNKVDRIDKSLVELWNLPSLREQRREEEPLKDSLSKKIESIDDDQVVTGRFGDDISEITTMSGEELKQYLKGGRKIKKQRYL